MSPAEVVGTVLGLSLLGLLAVGGAEFRAWRARRAAARETSTSTGSDRLDQTMRELEQAIAEWSERMAEQAQTRPSWDVDEELLRTALADYHVSRQLTDDQHPLCERFEHEPPWPEELRPPVGTVLYCVDAAGTPVCVDRVVVLAVLSSGKLAVVDVGPDGQLDRGVDGSRPPWVGVASGKDCGLELHATPEAALRTSIADAEYGLGYAFVRAAEVSAIRDRLRAGASIDDLCPWLRIGKMPADPSPNRGEEPT